MLFTTDRFPFNESLKGSARTTRQTPTTMVVLVRASQGPRAASERGSHRLQLEALDDVALLEVAEAVERNTALVAGRHFARVVLETTQGLDVAIPEGHTVADDTRLAGAENLAVQHVGAC